MLFCETCAEVFCSVCNASHGVDGSGDHTVIPASIAIKRMSEILNHKANECMGKFEEAIKIVTEEIHRLDHNAAAAFENINTVFEDVAEVVERKRREVLNNVRQKKDEKKKVLAEQLNMIEVEQSKVDEEVSIMRNQVDVRNITKKISEINGKLDTVSQLAEPRENSYIEFIKDESSTHLQDIDQKLQNAGIIKSSKTFPSLCRLTMNTVIAHLETTAVVQTIDYNGMIQETGGDPVKVEITNAKGDQIKVSLVDLEDGTYLIRFTPHQASQHCIKVFIFNRPIQDSPLHFNVTQHNSPLSSFGTRGVNDTGFVQPCALTVDQRGNVYVMDTGNCRIKVLTSNLVYKNHINNDCLKGRSVTGMCLGSSANSLIVVNWRSKMITEISLDGLTLGAFSHEDLVEPIAVAVNHNGEVFVADNGVGAILMFDASGKLIRKIGKKGNKRGEFRDMSSVCVSNEGDIIVADTRIIVFNPDGEFIKEMGCSEKEGPKGRYSGLAVDRKGFLVAARMEKGMSYVQVFNLSDSSIYSTIDSHGARLKRPTGVALCPTLGDNHIYVVDIGQDCVRKYRYC